MNADTTDRAPLDDPLMNQLRSTLDAVEEAEARRPSTVPPWNRIQLGMRRARRHRRRVRLARFGAGLVACCTLAGTVVSGVVPYPALAPVVTIPGTGGRSALDDGRTRGSLGTDANWLQALREHVASGEVSDEDGGEFWGPPAARNLSVLFAGDVGEYRLALVEGNWHWGPIGARQQVWLLGPAGAPAERLVQGANHSPEDQVSAIYAPGTGEPGHTTTAVVVLSPTPAKVELEHSPVITAAAEVTQPVTTLIGVDGLYQAAITTPGLYSLRINGTVSEHPFEATSQDSPTAAAQAPARGGAKMAGAPLSELAWAARTAVRQPTGGAGAESFRLLAVEEPARPTTVGPIRALVGLVTLPGGARMLAAGELLNGDFPQVRMDSGRVIPAAASQDSLAIAWRRTPDRRGPGANDPGWTAAMGPVGTARVQWVHRGGSITSAAAQHTVSATERDDVESVRFLDANGNRIGSAPVLATLDQDAPLPEVAAAPRVLTDLR